jgi:hypothetical protein
VLRAIHDETSDAIDLRFADVPVGVGDGLSQGSCTVIGNELRNDRREHIGMISTTYRRRSSMVEKEKTELAGKSDELLGALRQLKDTEQRKRHEPISSDKFHELANEVDAISHEVFSIARTQRDIGERTTRTGETIEDVELEERSANGRS